METFSNVQFDKCPLERLQLVKFKAEFSRSVIFSWFDLWEKGESAKYLRDQGTFPEAGFPNHFILTLHCAGCLLWVKVTMVKFHTCPLFPYS